MPMNTNSHCRPLLLLCQNQDGTTPALLEAVYKLVDNNSDKLSTKFLLTCTGGSYGLYIAGCPIGSNGQHGVALVEVKSIVNITHYDRRWVTTRSKNDTLRVFRDHEIAMRYIHSVKRVYNCV